MAPKQTRSLNHTC